MKPPPPPSPTAKRSRTSGGRGSRGRDESLGSALWWACSRQGAELARRLAAELGGTVRPPARLALPGEAGYRSLLPAVARAFPDHAAHVFVCAAGIAVRAIAPLLAAKDADPAVIVLDQAGRFAVPILSGHLGGANELARRIAAATGGQPVITTGTDLAGLPAIDLLAQERNMTIVGLEAVKAVSAALLDGAAVPLVDREERLFPPDDPRRVHFPSVRADEARELPLAVWVDWRETAAPRGHLLLVPRVLAAGVGCRRGAGAGEILDCLRAACARAGAHPSALAVLGSVELKADEAGLLDAARRLGLRVAFFAAGELAAVDVPTPSARVAQAAGTPSVAEAAALLLARNTELICEKTIAGRVTAALALMRTEREE